MHQKLEKNLPRKTVVPTVVMAQFGPYGRGLFDLHDLLTLNLCHKLLLLSTSCTSDLNLLLTFYRSF